MDRTLILVKPDAFARDYGPLSPLPGHHFVGAGTLGANESLRFRHRVLVHEGDTETADVDGHYHRWLDADGEP